MVKKLIIVLIATFAFQIHAQEGTASPYSFYGIGSLKFKGTTENRSMGGLGIYTDSIHINLKNPASFTGNNLEIYNNESRPVKFTVGGSYSSINLKSNSGDDKTNVSTFDYFALSVPLGKFGFGFGLLPYSSVGYKLEASSNDVVTNRHTGEGGLNKVFASFAYQINEKLSIGVESSYNFGNIQNSAIAFVYNDEGELVQYQSRENNRSNLSGLNFNIGLTYKTMISEKHQLIAGLTYAPKSDITSKNTRSFSTIVINSETGQEFVINTIDADLAAANLQKTDLTLPSRYSFGAGIGQPNNWFVGGEYSFLKTSQFENAALLVSNATYTDASTFALGGFFIPDYNSFSSYWKRIVFRAGIRYENSGLEINNESINEFGMSFGVGLPVGNVFSNANLGFEFGQRGTTNQNLVQENFVNILISLSLNDRWFQKRKYN